MEEEELLQDSTIESMWEMVRGDFLHQLTYAYKWREMDMEYYVPLKDGRTTVLAGRLDMYDWKSKTIMDLKTTKFIKWKKKQGSIPKPEHILQLQCYYVMFSQTIPVEKLNIIYADMSDIITYNVKKRDLSEWIKMRIGEIEDSLLEKKFHVVKLRDFKYCRYQTKCYSDGNGLTDKPLSIPKMQQNYR
jgi:hypothetical protein